MTINFDSNSLCTEPNSSNGFFFGGGGFGNNKPSKFQVNLLTKGQIVAVRPHPSLARGQFEVIFAMDEAGRVLG